MSRADEHGRTQGMREHRDRPARPRGWTAYRGAWKRSVGRRLPECLRGLGVALSDRVTPAFTALDLVPEGIGRLKLCISA